MAFLCVQFKFYEAFSDFSFLPNGFKCFCLNKHLLRNSVKISLFHLKKISKLLEQIEVEDKEK